MATQIIPARLSFPRWHNSCDRCDVEVTNAFGPTRKCMSHREDAAGMFTYVLCANCSTEVENKRPSTRENAYRRALVRHAAKYSADYARFVASWFGVRLTKRLLEA